MASQLRHIRAVALSGAAVGLALILVTAHASGGSNSRVVSGVVSIVNAFQSKVCITEDGSNEQWCGPLAVSGESVTAGQHVTMVINPLKTADDNALEIGTVVPPEYRVAP